jgi:hypothetical protein
VVPEGVCLKVIDNSSSIQKYKGDAVVEPWVRQQQYPRISGGFSDGITAGSMKQYGDLSPLQPIGNTGGYVPQVSSSPPFGETNSNGMITSRVGVIEH